MNSRFAIALVSALVLAALSSHGCAAEITKDTLDTVKEKIADEEAVLADVREKREWDQGHVEGAVFLPLSTLKKGVDRAKLAKRLPKDKIVYTHCAVGVRSVAAGNILEKLGYDVRPLKPGYKDLLKAGFKKAEEKDEKKAESATK